MLGNAHRVLSAAQIKAARGGGNIAFLAGHCCADAQIKANEAQIKVLESQVKVVEAQNTALKDIAYDKALAVIKSQKELFDDWRMHNHKKSVS